MSEPSPDIVEIAPDQDLVFQKSVFLASSPTFDDCYHSFSGQKDKSPSFPLFEKPWKGTTIDVLEIWLRAFHGNLNEASFKIAIPKVYDIMAIAQKYCFELKDPKPWFDQWYEKNKGDIKEQLLLLCWEFRHDKAFLQLSGFLVYHPNGRVTALSQALTTA
ncbi:hypothetical protein BGW36DRAFT_429203 [Talaromyces proteolyticus]|uniref:Uncharacterized protein n=1 Tax=Talaromyces proteolyticus TaxID=1131652 RepID=A0AAD4PZ57_9EURO|nr:uncharacterized protein BGW36DRAFT_429203 [Talaromyces proteolyticus]KAH8695324.1 hypothetical protein BGW36DRAFT_429203 [Talaromyces proteolyticus]